MPSPSAATRGAAIAGLFFLFLAALAGCASEKTSPTAPAPTYEDLTPLEAFQLIENTADLYIIDVSDHYQSGFIPRAVNFSLDRGIFEVIAPRLNPDRTYLIYSYDDESSRTAAEMLIDLGFTDVYRLDGSFPAWVSAGLPVTRPSG
jgi:rhodanese-related sulfurtransferase